MAYVSQDLKQSLAPAIKAICKKFGIKATLAVQNHSTLVLNIKSGKIDFIGNYNSMISTRYPSGNHLAQPAKDTIRVNHYWIDSSYSGKAKDFLNAVYAAMNVGNHNNSDPMTDYFDVGWYIDINVGKWNKPYVLE